MFSSDRMGFFVFKHVLPTEKTSQLGSSRLGAQELLLVSRARTKAVEGGKFQDKSLGRSMHLKPRKA